MTIDLDLVLELERIMFNFYRNVFTGYLGLQKCRWACTPGLQIIRVDMDGRFLRCDLA